MEEVRSKFKAQRVDTETSIGRIPEGRDSFQLENLFHRPSNTGICWGHCRDGEKPGVNLGTSCVIAFPAMDASQSTHIKFRGSFSSPTHSR